MKLKTHVSFLALSIMSFFFTGTPLGAGTVRQVMDWINAAITTDRHAV